MGVPDCARYPSRHRAVNVAAHVEVVRQPCWPTRNPRGCGFIPFEPSGKPKGYPCHANQHQPSDEAAAASPDRAGPAALPPTQADSRRRANAAQPNPEAAAPAAADAATGGKTTRNGISPRRSVRMANPVARTSARSPRATMTVVGIGPPTRRKADLAGVSLRWTRSAGASWPHAEAGRATVVPLARNRMNAASPAKSTATTAALTVTTAVLPETRIFATAAISAKIAGTTPGGSATGNFATRGPIAPRAGKAIEATGG